MQPNELKEILYNNCYSFKEAMDILDISKQRFSVLRKQNRLRLIDHPSAKLVMKEDVDELKQELLHMRDVYRPYDK